MVIILQARTKRAAKLDPDVGNLSKDTVVAITKATELFVAYMAVRSSQIAAYRGARQIKDSDVLQAIHTNEALQFLKMDFPRKNLLSDAPSSSARLQATSTANKKQTQKKTFVAKHSTSFATSSSSSAAIEDEVNSSMEPFGSLGNVAEEQETMSEEVTSTGKHAINSNFQPPSKIAHTVDNEVHGTPPTSDAP